MRYVIGLSFAALAVWVLQATGILMAIMMFLLIGSVPGTRISVPPTYMFVLLGVISVAVVYWLFRLRPVQQIQDMKYAHHQKISEANEAVTAPKPSLVAAGFARSYAPTRTATRRMRYGMLANLNHSLSRMRSTLARRLTPVQMTILACGAVMIIVSHEVATWARPHLRTLAAWTAKQIRYSFKGTMLSAHRWSSLSKKLFSSLTSLLKRCSSVLKRGKSLLIRSTR